MYKFGFWFVFGFKYMYGRIVCNGKYLTMWLSLLGNIIGISDKISDFISLFKYVKNSDILVPSLFPILVFNSLSIQFCIRKPNLV
ncbi:hypothetical protein J5U21_02021 [Saccharolobus shibatae]|uniref:Uncharacterized protein n=1 Tax=Saccharolobus shibatae TaxID=2286 RepID=A0A8F5GWT6_9CREN|nr:hypothetical protein J5U21_02021 [Saccharolobus shibatae]